MATYKNGRILSLNPLTTKDYYEGNVVVETRSPFQRKIKIIVTDFEHESQRNRIVVITNYINGVMFDQNQRFDMSVNIQT